MASGRPVGSEIIGEFCQLPVSEQARYEQVAREAGHDHGQQQLIKAATRIWKARSALDATMAASRS